MPAELLALSAAFCWASAGIAVKFATQTGGVLLGLVITLASSLVTLGAFALVTVDSWTMPAPALVLFALAGVTGPGVGRILLMRSVRDAGTSVAVPVYASTYPVFGSAAGVALFGETVGLGRVIALALIVSGIWACVHGGSANRVPDLGRGQAGVGSVLRLRVLLVPAAAGTAFATTDVFTKLALAEHGDPILGALIGIVTAFVIWLTVFAVRVPQGREPLRISPSLGWFCVNGLLTATAQAFLFLALRIGDLSAVTPIVASQPVIVIVLGALVLRNLERLRVGTVVGAVVVFFGVAYLSAA